MESVLLIVILVGLPVLFAFLYAPDLTRLIKGTKPKGMGGRTPFVLAIAGLMSAVLAGAFGVEEADQPLPEAPGVAALEAPAEEPGTLETAVAKLSLDDKKDWETTLGYLYMVFYVIVVFASVIAVARASDEHKAIVPEVRAIAWGGIGVLIAIARNTLLG